MVGPSGADRDSAPDAPVTTRRGVLLAGAVLLAGCTASTKRTVTASVPATLTRADAQVLAPALAAENKGLVAYAAAIPLLKKGPAADLASHALGQELDHAQALSAMIQQAGGHASNIRPSYDFGRPRDSADALRLLHDVERWQVSAYLDAIPRLSPGPARATVAAIFANDAQHLALIRQALGLEPLTQPFPTGSE